MFGYHPHGEVPILQYRCPLTKPGILYQVSSACRLPPASPKPDHAKPKIHRGAMCNFASDSTGFSRGGFPGVHPHLLTLNSKFSIPFYHEILLLLGVCSVSKRSCERILRKGNGSAITIVVGGAAESLSAHPGTADLTLRKRYVVLSSAWFDAGVDWWLCLPDWVHQVRDSGGVCPIIRFCTDHALIFRLHSADLVPVFSFGENDVRFLSPIVGLRLRLTPVTH